MKLLEAYPPNEVRAAGRMVKAIMAAGGAAEDILGYAAYAEKHGANPIVARSKLMFKIPEGVKLTSGELLGAIGYETLRQWIKLSREILKLRLDINEIQNYIRSERKKELSSTKFGWVRG